MLIHEQFDVIPGKGDLANCGGPEHTWGYDDEFIFDRALREFDASDDRPFFGYILTVSNHSPYENQRVPLILYAPAIVSPARRQVIASHTDILPTVAG